MEDSWCSVRNCEGGEQRKKRNAAYPYDDFKVDYKNFLSQVFFCLFGMYIYIYNPKKITPRKYKFTTRIWLAEAFQQQRSNKNIWLLGQKVKSSPTLTSVLKGVTELLVANKRKLKIH